MLTTVNTEAALSDRPRPLLQVSDAFGGGGGAERQPGCSRAAGQVINGLPYFKRQSENIGGTAQASLAPPWLVFHPICLRRFSLSSVLMGPQGLTPCQLFFSPPPPPLFAPNAPSSVWWWVAHGEGASPPKGERGKKKKIHKHSLFEVTRHWFLLTSGSFFFVLFFLKLLQERNFKFP